VIIFSRISLRLSGASNLWGFGLEEVGSSLESAASTNTLVQMLESILQAIG
jgi:hypothetical protein